MSLSILEQQLLHYAHEINHVLLYEAQKHYDKTLKVFVNSVMDNTHFRISLPVIADNIMFLPNQSNVFTNE
jgi:hypothetical protein